MRYWCNMTEQDRVDATTRLIESTLAATEARLKEAEEAVCEQANGFSATIADLKKELTAQSEIADGLAASLKALKRADAGDDLEPLIRQADAWLKKHAALARHAAAKEGRT